ncbi:PQQ-dependent sugar dehydrogenase [Actinospongicola halichondriae]|uniref:PQQ-dependent sugar dehydrogenase n=1 Tax=Actinospongicola halichondriae TaxID=3236844 RepID=UPI003D4071F7
MKQRTIAMTAIGLVLALLGVAAPLASTASAAGPTLPEGYVRTTVATNLVNPVGMEIGPDGRIYVLTGRQERVVRVIEDDVLDPTPYLVIPEVLNLEMGLHGITWHPDFAANPYVYVSYITAADANGPQRFELVRYLVVGRTPDTSTKQVLFSIPDWNTQTQLHQGGDLAFGADGKLYWALGERVKPSLAQDMGSFAGKVLRLDPDGSIPTDNPYFDTLTGGLRAIYASGLRNPWRIEARADGEIYISDVGATQWEEVNHLAAGANFGWPVVTGQAGNPSYTDPVWVFPHFVGETFAGCAITGGAFMPPGLGNFPPVHDGTFFVGDHCKGWIDAVDVETGTSERFLEGLVALIDVVVDPVTGSLYYLDRTYEGDADNQSGGIGRIDHDADAPLSILTQPVDRNAAIGGSVTFGVEADGPPPLTYQWRRDGSAIDGATAASLTISDLTADDDGATFDVVITAGNGASVTSDPATLTISDNTAPTATITLPTGEDLWTAGDTIDFAGTASDDEDGALDGSAMQWQVVFHHNTHTHPFLDDVDGTDSGSFEIPTTGETAADIWYRIHLTVTDSGGAQTSTHVDVHPVVNQMRIETQPAGLSLTIDAEPITTPHTFDGVAGIERVVDAPEPRWIGPTAYAFDSWSDGGAEEHAWVTPGEATTLTADYVVDERPITTFVSPSAGAEVATGTVISGEAYDQIGIELVSIQIKRLGAAEYWNGSQWQPTPTSFFATLGTPQSDGTVPWTYTIGDLPPGSFQLTANAKDLVGKRHWVQRVFSIPDATDQPPVVAIGSPGAGEAVATPFVVSGTAADDHSVTRVSVQAKRVGADQWWDGSTWQPFKTSFISDFTAAADVQWSNQFAIPAGVSVQLSALARDSIGQSVYVQRVVHVVEPGVDEPPTIEITGPAAGETVTPSVTIEGLAHDDRGVASVTLQLKRVGASEWWNGTAWQSAKYTFAATTVPTSPEGTEGWSADFLLPAGVSVQISAAVRDTGGQFRYVQRVIHIG